MSHDMEPVSSFDQVSFFASSIVAEGCESTRSGSREQCGNEANQGEGAEQNTRVS